jgi:hypothetical protein
MQKSFVGHCAIISASIESVQNNQLLIFLWQPNPIRGGKCDARRNSAHQENNWKCLSSQSLCSLLPCV